MLARIIISLARFVYNFAGPIVARYAGVLMISAVVGSCLLVWAHALVFTYVDLRILAPASTLALEAVPFSFLAPATWGLPPHAIATLIETGGGLAAMFTGVLKYLLWPLQFGYFRDIMTLTAIVAFFNIVPAFVIWWERKVAGREKRKRHRL